MFAFKNKFAWLIFLLAIFVCAPAHANAKGDHYKAVVKHLKTKYQARKVKIPMVWLARFAVRMIRPAGVKSFSVTMFENLKIERDTLDGEMQTALRGAFDAEWTSLLRVRSRAGEQAYLYMRETDKGNSVRIMLVTINKDQAAVIRAAFSPEKLADFVNDPKVFGFSLSDTNRRQENQSVANDSTTDSAN